jgi:von Willebrand factor type A domain
MSRHSAPFDDALPRADWRSLAFSASFHCVVFVLLGLLWTSRPSGSGDEPGRPVDIVLAPLDDSNDYLEKNDVQPVPESGKEGEDTSAILPTSDKAPVDISEILDSQAPVDVPLPGFSSADFARSDAQSGTSNSGELSPEQQAMLAAEQAAFEARRPKGAPATLRVFGSGDITGRKFVFVIDRSRSMGSDGLNVIQAASSELSNTIAALEDFHQFQIIAYHHENVFIEKRGLLDANPGNKGRVKEFIQNLAAFGGTEHESALATALSLNPDVVVLMSDGGLPELNQSQMRRIRQSAGNTRIHCLEFGRGPRQKTDTFMRTLAAESSGTYRYIDVSQWNK